MREIAIIGGGLCSLALAKTLQIKGRDFVIFEARQRLGGRIFSVPFKNSDIAAVDLGPTWFWPDTQPLMTQLVADLGLVDFPQYEEGAVLHLRDPDKTPERLDQESIHHGARRLEGGMASLVTALARVLSPERLQLGHVLTGLEDRPDHIRLSFRCGEKMVDLAAKHVVLALPPRLLEEQVHFVPELDSAVREAMRATETWMAAQAKIIMDYDRPYWRDEGLSGDAFVTHDQAVIGEIFDACDDTGTKAALGGFLALPPDLRQSFRDGLPLLMGNQMTQVFGPTLEHGEQYYQDWATEPFTCSALDRDTPRLDHVDFANPFLRRPLWEGKLYLGGSETAAHGAGYLEGALEAAKRIDRDLSHVLDIANQPKLPIGQSIQSTHIDGDMAFMNASSLAQFKSWVGKQSGSALDSYRHRLNHNLANQQRDQLTQRAILETVEEVYSKALLILDDLPFDTSEIHVERGRSAMTPEVQAPFRDFMQALVDDVVAFNRTSCALSNFPQEHHPSKEYMQTILRDIAAAWQEFSLAANKVLLSKARGQSQRASTGK